jgi:hypothetical protein
MPASNAASQTLIVHQDSNAMDAFAVEQLQLAVLVIDAGLIQIALLVKYAATAIVFLLRADVLKQMNAEVRTIALELDKYAALANVLHPLLYAATAILMATSNVMEQI